jgi:hypothetical protein
MPVGMELVGSQPKEATAVLADFSAAGSTEITEQRMEKTRWTKE